MSALTRESVIESFHSFKRRSGYQPVSREAGSAYGLPSYDSVVRLFGSWNAAVEAAGFRPYPPKSSAQAKTMAHRDRNKQNG